MEGELSRKAPGRVRDAILEVLDRAGAPLTLAEIASQVSNMIGPTARSSVRSYLQLNTPDLFIRASRGCYSLRRRDDDDDGETDVAPAPGWPPPWRTGRAELYHADCFEWLRLCERCSIHAVVTDPPYGLHEYSPEQQAKLRRGKGGVWRIPPSFDGNERSPVPRFTTLTDEQIEELRAFFTQWGCLLMPVLTPGANVLVASNPLVSHVVSDALTAAGLERRGEIIRLTMTMRGGDRPKAAHEEFREVSVMPRSMWEPWLVYRRPLEGTVRENLRTWKTGGFRRPSRDKPFGDVISSAPTRKAERDLAPHPSLKPQAFLRQVVRAALPLGEGVVLDPFAGAGSTLAAAEAVGYASIGLEKDPHYFHMATEAIGRLLAYRNGESSVNSDTPSSVAAS